MSAFRPDLDYDNTAFRFDLAERRRLNGLRGVDLGVPPPPPVNQPTQICQEAFQRYLERFSPYCLQYLTFLVYIYCKYQWINSHLGCFTKSFTVWCFHGLFRKNMYF